MNKDIFQGKWKEFEGAAKKRWAKLGDVDLKLLAEGNLEEFSGKLQSAYGKSKDDATKEIREFQKSCGFSTSDKAA